MNAHLTLAEYGQFVGIKQGRLTVKQDGQPTYEYSLNRLKTIQIAKSGVSFSSDVVMQCALRGIKLFVLDFQGKAVACLSGTQQHAVVAVRQKQFEFINSKKVSLASAQFIYGKLRNQRATLLYFSKYHSDKSPRIQLAADQIAGIAQEVNKQDWPKYAKWREILLGLEGQGSRLYWKCLQETGLLPANFTSRIGRNAQDSTNKALNYGYAILTSFVWHCIINTGLEAYAGCLHVQRAGKPSLVLDVMEEYRAWAVDRTIIKARELVGAASDLTPKVKKQIIGGVHKTFDTRYHYQNRKMRLESILQRQVYKLAGTFAGDKKYRPYRFRW